MSVAENELIIDKVKERNLLWVPWLLIIYNFTANLSNDIYLPSMPKLVHVFGTTPSIVQLTITAWFAGVAVPQLIFGPMSDRFGRRPLLMGGGISFVVATLVAMFSTNVWILILARFFQGVGVCSLNVSTFSVVSDLYEYKVRARIMAKISMCGTLAPLIGPVLGSYILLISWRVDFLLVFLLGLISVIGLFTKLPESNLSLDPHAMKMKNIFKSYYLLVSENDDFLKFLLPYCLTLGGLVTYLTASPFLIINRFHYSPQFFGFTQLAVFGAYIIGGWYFHTANEDDEIRLMLHRGLKIVLLATFTMFGLSCFLNNIWILMGPMVLYGFGFSLCASPLITEVMSFPTPTKGSAAAFLGFGMAMSCVACCALLSSIYNGTVFSLAIILLSTAMLSTFMFFRHRKAS